MANYKEYIESGKAILGIEFGSTRIKGSGESYFRHRTERPA